MSSTSLKFQEYSKMSNNEISIGAATDKENEITDECIRKAPNSSLNPLLEFMLKDKT